MKNKINRRFFAILSVVLFVGIFAYINWQVDLWPENDFLPELSASELTSPMYVSEAERLDLYQAAQESLRQQQYVTGIAVLQYLANDGYAKAAFDLSSFYESGINDLPLSAEQAFNWCLKSALVGYGPASWRLAHYYRQGFGINENSDLAFTWLKKSSEQDISEAMLELGLCYEFGIGVAQDYHEAIQYYRSEAAIGNVTAAANLGRILCLGPVEVRSLADGISYLQQARKAGIAAAMVNLGLLSELAGNFSMALEFYMEAALAGDLYACYNQARLLQRGISLTNKEPINKEPINKEHNLAEVFSLYFTAAEGGVREAIVVLADLLLQKKGNIQQIRRFRQLYVTMQELSEQGYADVQRALADLLLLANDVFVSDAKQAYQLYKKAAAQQNSLALYGLGYGYEQGLFGNIDLEEAAAYYEKAVQIDKEPYSAYRLGLMYWQNKGVKQNYLRAYQLLQLAQSALGEQIVASSLLNDVAKNFNLE